MRKLYLLTLVSLMTAGSLFAADVYTLDGAHSNVNFCVKHMVISTVCGRFNQFEATINFDEADVTKSSWTGTIKTASITTDNEKRDNHLKSADFFDVEKHPEITFKSSKIEKKGDGYVAAGTLTMRGVSKEVSIPFTVTGPITVFGGKRIGISATLTVNRQDYGVSWSQKLDSGGLVVSDEVKINLDAEAVMKK